MMHRRQFEEKFSDGVSSSNDHAVERVDTKEVTLTNVRSVSEI